MMVSKNEIVQIVYSAIDEVNLELPADGKMEKSLLEVLLGDKSKLDSLSFINFVMAVEKGLREKCGVTITLVTQDTMASVQSPFQSVDKLADYIVSVGVKKND